MPRDPIASPAVDQGDVIDWLSSPHGTNEPVERIDTHISVVFLRGDRAFKLKRALQYDYVDYSTVERRREACLTEVALNRRTAPSLYLGVRAVTQEPEGAFALDGDGSAVDWLVEMVRFDQEALLSRLADRHALDIGLMPSLARAIFRFHELAEWQFDHGGRAGMQAVVSGNRDGLRDYGAAAVDASTLQRLTDASFAAIDRRGDQLEQRRLSGFVRRGHGDLHLGNVCLIEGTPTLFDCIEFSRAIASVDVLYDVAFVLMDLVHRGLDRHANELFNQYVRDETPLDGLSLMPLFLSVRAAVRAKTSVTTATLQPDRKRASQLRDDAAQYLGLAENLLSPPPARLVAVGGLSGTGKTTLARRLAPVIGAAPGALVLRSDVVRKELMGVPPLERLGPEGYTDSVNHLVYRTLGERAATALAAGHSVVVDAVFGEARDRAVVADLGRAHQVPFLGFWLEASEQIMTARLSDRTADESDATPDLLSHQRRRASVPTGWTRLQADRSPDDLERLSTEVLALKPERPRSDL